MEKSFGLIVFDGKSANENCRKNRFHRKSRSATHHHVSDILRDFQRHSRDISSAAGNISESHTHLLSDDDYGQLYCPSATEDESVDLNKGRGHPNVPPTAVGGASAGAQFFEPSAYFDQDVPGPAPEIEPPRPAPSSAASGGGVGSISQFYKSTTAKLRNPEYHQMVDYDQHPLLNGGPAAYDYGGPTSYDTGSSRYLDVPSSNNYHTQPHSSNRYSFDASAVSRINDGLSATLPTSSHQSATFTRQHSWESPVRYRRMQYGYACMAISHDTS